MRISLLICSKVKGFCLNWYKYLIFKKKRIGNMLIDLK